MDVCEVPVVDYDGRLMHFSVRFSAIGEVTIFSIFGFVGSTAEGPTRSLLERVWQIVGDAREFLMGGDLNLEPHELRRWPPPLRVSWHP